MGIEGIVSIVGVVGVVVACVCGVACVVSFVHWSSAVLGAPTRDQGVGLRAIA